MLLLAGCDGSVRVTEIEPTLRFADLDDTSITVLACLGFEGAGRLAMASVDNYASNPPTPGGCPRVTRTAGLVTIEGGCAGFDGSVRIVTDEKRRYEFSQFAFGDRHFDGVVIKNYELDLQVRISLSLGVRAYRSEVDITCDADTCTSDGGIEWIGYGGAAATGTVYADHLHPDAYKLDGIDRLSVSYENGNRWSIAGTNRAEGFTCDF